MTGDWLRAFAQPGDASMPARLLRQFVRRWYLLRSRNCVAYYPPISRELEQIESDMLAAGMAVESLSVDGGEFDDFVRAVAFPQDYYGDASEAIRGEKLLEHFVAAQLIDVCSPRRSPYVDVAACASPWAMLLRGRGVEAFAIDLEIPPRYAAVPYYEQQDATAMRFAQNSIGSASLHCAFEMFGGGQDSALIRELARVLRPGGRAVILPLYMHTHACRYQSPEFVGLMPQDEGAASYVRRDCWGVSSSRKYSVQTLLDRVWRPALEVGLAPRIGIVRNAATVVSSAYLHFVLLLDKPQSGMVPR